MLSVRPRITELRFHVFARSIHPELFDACVTRVVERANYRLTVHITSAGHLIAFEHAGNVMTEICAAAHQPLPQQRVLLSHTIDRPVARAVRFRELLEHRSEVEFEGVNPRTFLMIHQQLEERPRCEGLLHRFEPSGRNTFEAVSYINVQSFAQRVNLRCFHTFPDTCAVMKSESSFRISPPADADSSKSAG